MPDFQFYRKVKKKKEEVGNNYFPPFFKSGNSYIRQTLEQLAKLVVAKYSINHDNCILF